jgi:nicotinamide riboside transporter PnuC
VGSVASPPVHTQPKRASPVQRRAVSSASAMQTTLYTSALRNLGHSYSCTVGSVHGVCPWRENSPFVVVVVALWLGTPLQLTGLVTRS